MLLGTVDITQNVKGDRKEIEQVADFSDVVSCERLPIVQNFMPKLDLSFMSLQRRLLPRFSFHLWKGNRVSPCEFHIWRDQTLNRYRIEFPVESSVPIIRDIIANRYGRADEWHTDGAHNQYIRCILRKEKDRLGLDMKWGDGRWYCYKTVFHGIIPDDIKREVVLTRPLFDAQGIIKEVESWAETVIEKDPIVVGFIDTECFLIGHFDCTDIEDYARREFSQ